ncbi:HD domain-containing protein [Antarcticibacterium sp. 1MA-6-2]|uniref:HD domain-containing protein n=1 Tax=Antarcticibacterium sp. 1MA-6-2 TaxID=2908210 RepID=UPI001F3C6CE2|nr:HD domain-containing protein [Antarcticibacterium sp. 1MA-6-2]UJH92179.1 HD domain-containing protein [Antarcticibacterium sp. 1MA-6-2]
MEFFQKVYDKVITDLEQGLPPWLTYHNANHTRYVLQKAEEIAKEENVFGQDLLLVKVAALYHDTGFLKDRPDHEKLSCEIFIKDFKVSHFSPVEKEKICKIIKATKVPQNPNTLLEKIVADADLEYLGTELFNSFSRNLHREILHFEPDIKDRAWDELQINFLSNHKYHTKFCKSKKELGKTEKSARSKRKVNGT